MCSASRDSNSRPTTTWRTLIRCSGIRAHQTVALSRSSLVINRPSDDISVNTGRLKIGSKLEKDEWKSTGTPRRQSSLYTIETRLPVSHRSRSSRPRSELNHWPILHTRERVFQLELPRPVSPILQIRAALANPRARRQSHIE